MNAEAVTLSERMFPLFIVDAKLGERLSGLNNVCLVIWTWADLCVHDIRRPLGRRRSIYANFPTIGHAIYIRAMNEDSDGSVWSQAGGPVRYRHIPNDDLNRSYPTKSRRFPV